MALPIDSIDYYSYDINTINATISDELDAEIGSSLILSVFNSMPWRDGVETSVKTCMSNLLQKHFTTVNKCEICYFNADRGNKFTRVVVEGFWTEPAKVAIRTITCTIRIRPKDNTTIQDITI